MRRRLTALAASLATAVLATAVLAACAPPGASGPGASASRAFTPADRAAVEAVLATQVRAWNAGDLPGYMDGYARTPDLVFTSGGRIRRGWQEAFDAYQQRYGGDRAGMGTLRLEVLSVQPLGADGAVVLGRWALTDTPNAGGGVFSVILERRPEGWRVVHDHTSADPPATP